MGKDSNDKLIDSADVSYIKKLSEKYDMSLVNFCHIVIRQEGNNLTRQIRVTDEEFEIIKDKAKKNKLNMSKYCSLACSNFLKSGFNNISVSDFTIEKSKRTKRIGVTLRNQGEEYELMKIATKFSIKIATLIRYCALNYNE